MHMECLNECLYLVLNPFLQSLGGFLSKSFLDNHLELLDATGRFFGDSYRMEWTETLDMDFPGLSG
jgi:hypothetical protein